eukprot:7517616-Lingulodinium_polyedra.AAC.1
MYDFDAGYLPLPDDTMVRWQEGWAARAQSQRLSDGSAGGGCGMSTRRLQRWIRPSGGWSVRCKKVGVAPIKARAERPRLRRQRRAYEIM